MDNYGSVAALLPQQAPMLLLDEVVEVKEESAHCRVRVGNDSVLAPFLDRTGNLPGWFVLEMMAQTVDVWFGWRQRQTLGASPRPGMLLGARALCCHQPTFCAGSILDIRVILLMRDDKFGSFDSEISQDGKLLASARLAIYQPGEEELQQLLQQELLQQDGVE